MAEEVPTTEELNTEAFWAARDAHTASVRAALQAVLDLIQVGIDSNLYRDGITVKLNEVKLATTHHVNQLSPNPAPTGPLMPPANYIPPA